jgi:hypothetical protein
VSRQASDKQATGKKLLVTSLQQVYNKFTTSPQRVATGRRQAGLRQARGCCQQVEQGHGRQEVVGQGHSRQEVVVNKLDRVTTGSRLLVTSLRQVCSMVETSMRQRGDRQSDGRQVHNRFATSFLQCRNKQATGR